MKTASDNLIPTTVHQIWLQGENQIPPQYQQWRQTVLQHNPHFEHRLWSQPELMDLLEQHYPHYLDFYKRLPHMHLQIDMIKPILLHRFGGIYIDMDCIALNNFRQVITQPLPPHSYETFCHNPGVIMQRMFCLPGATDYAFLNNNFIASQKGHPFLLNIVDSGIEYFNTLPARYRKEKYMRRVILESFGPRRLTHCYHQYCKHDNDINILNSGVFEFSEFEKRVGQFYGIPGIHNSTSKQPCISHHYEVTWMPETLQKRFKIGYHVLPQILEYHYAPKNNWDKLKGLPWVVMQKAMSHIKWNKNLIGEHFCQTPHPERIEQQYSVYAQKKQPL